MPKTKKEIVPAEVSTLLRQGGYLRAFEALVKDAERRAVKVPKTTVAQRKEILKDIIETLPPEKLAELQNTLASIVDYIATNVIDLSTERVMDAQEAKSLMAEFLAIRTAIELATVRKDEMIKARVFQAITAENRQKGLEDPHNTNGSIPVPELGMKFVREGCGIKETTINEGKLKEFLGEERWKTVCDAERVPRKVIPAHVNYTLSIERLMKLASDEPIVMEWIDASLDIGGWKTPRFAPKPM